MAVGPAPRPGDALGQERRAQALTPRLGGHEHAEVGDAARLHLHAQRADDLAVEHRRDLQGRVVAQPAVVLVPHGVTVDGLASDPPPFAGHDLPQVDEPFDVVGDHRTDLASTHPVDRTDAHPA